MKKKRPPQAFPRHPEYKAIELEWCRGSQLKDLCAKYDIPFGTIKRWHTDYNWSDKRRDFEEEVDKTIFVQQASLIGESVSNHLEAVRLISKACQETIAELYEEGDQVDEEGNRKGHRHNRKVYSEWASLLQKTSLVHKNVVPEANDKQVEAMLSELRRLGRLK